MEQSIDAVADGMPARVDREQERNALVSHCSLSMCTHTRSHYGALCAAITYAPD
jgi:hypothetical protein